MIKNIFMQTFEWEKHQKKRWKSHFSFLEIFELHKIYKKECWLSFFLINIKNSY